MLLCSFTGRWVIAREIEDRAAGQVGRFVGSAEFRPVPEGLAYREHGTLTLPGATPMAASRDYVWRDCGMGDIEVRFGDGRPFHRFSKAVPKAEHLCGPDHYAVTYILEAWPLWGTVWEVHGPRKDYRMVSRFRPAPSQSQA